MVELEREQAATLRERFPSRPGPCAGLHVINTGHGTIRADRWPRPRAVLARAGSDYGLAGDAAALDPAELGSLVAGFVDAPEPFVGVLQAAFDTLAVWERVVYALSGAPRQFRPSGISLRRLEQHDAGALPQLGPSNAWIANSWGGPEQLAASGYCWGAFADGELVSVACTFHLGDAYEEIGVVTAYDCRGRGLSTACAAALCEDIVARGHTPSWSTSTDNLASRRVAEKLGFTLQRYDRLFVAGVPIPT